MTNLSSILHGATGIPLWCGTSGGTANAQTLTPSPPLAIYSPGSYITFIAGYTNTGPMTVNVSGLGNVSILDTTGAQLSSSGVTAGSMYLAGYDGSAYRLSGGGTSIDDVEAMIFSF